MDERQATRWVLSSVPFTPMLASPKEVTIFRRTNDGQQHAVCTPPCRPASGLDRPKSGSGYGRGLRHVSLFRFLCPVSSLSEWANCRIAAAACAGGATTLP